MKVIVAEYVSSAKAIGLLKDSENHELFIRKHLENCVVSTPLMYRVTWFVRPNPNPALCSDIQYPVDRNGKLVTR